MHDHTHVTAPARRHPRGLALAGVLVPVTAAGEAVAGRVRGRQQQPVRQAPGVRRASRASASTKLRSRRSPTPTAATAPSGTPGYTASVDYVVETMAAAGWQVERVPFTYQDSIVTLHQLTPVSAGYAADGSRHRRRRRRGSPSIAGRHQPRRRPRPAPADVSRRTSPGSTSAGPQRHRPGPAWHVPVRRQGAQRRGRRRRGRDHLQPGQHARCRRAARPGRPDARRPASSTSRSSAPRSTPMRPLGRAGLDGPGARRPRRRASPRT